MQLAKKYINNNIQDILELVEQLPDKMLCNNDYDDVRYCIRYDMPEEEKTFDLTKKQLVSILNQVSQGTPINLAFRAEGLSSLFISLSKTSVLLQHKPDDFCEELTVYRLIERVWFKSLSRITNNIYQIAIDVDNKQAISAAKLLLEYHEQMEQKIKEYDNLRNIRG